jgi:predicted RNA binding protein YcfA (HicA-like mRNA interferase family)
MGKYEKLIKTILTGRADNNIKFKQLCNLLNSFGFKERIKGSHHIFFREDIEEILNIQSKSGNAKNYQVKQVRRLILKYNLEI